MVLNTIMKTTPKKINNPKNEEDLKNKGDLQVMSRPIFAVHWATGLSNMWKGDRG